MLLYLLGFMDQAPGMVAEKVGGLWDPIADGFEAVINHIIDGWNSLSFTIPGFEGLTVMGQQIVPGWNEVTIGQPVQIPHVSIPGGSSQPAPTIVGGQHAPPAFAKGGFVDAPLGKGVLALVHGGELILNPDQQAGRAPVPGVPSSGGRRRGRGGSTIIVNTNATTNRGTADAIDRRLMGWAG